LQSRNDPPSPFECWVWQAFPGQHAVPAQQVAPQLTGVCPPQPHVPAVQARPAPHAAPHAPQFAALVRVSTQAPAQQLSPAAQAWPHAPQLVVLVFVSTQAPEQFACPAGQQRPPWHDGAVVGQG
jgi:hypothetical protein